MVINFLRTAFAALALLAASAQAGAQDPVAFVADVFGEATVPPSATRVEFLAQVQPQTRIKVATGARVVILFTASGTEFRLAGPGEYRVGKEDVSAVSGEAPQRRNVAIRAEASAVSAASQLATASLRMRSIAPPPKPERFGPTYPRDSRIATLQPTLRWEGEPGPQGFAVTVLAADGKVAWKGTSQETSLLLPVRLAPASRYTWSVAGRFQALEAQFETLGAEAVARAESALKQARSFSDRVLHALVLRELGAAQDERDAWAALARERPDLPALAGLARP